MKMDAISPNYGQPGQEVEAGGGCPECGHKPGDIARLVSLEHETVLQRKTLNEKDRQIAQLQERLEKWQELCFDFACFVAGFKGTVYKNPEQKQEPACFECYAYLDYQKHRNGCIVGKAEKCLKELGELK